MTISFIRFAEPAFKGGRFENHALPVDVLPELATYRDLIIDLAKYLFLQRETSRKRVPKGFVESFQLVLRAIGDGSAIPILERVVSDTIPMDMIEGTDDFFTQARDQIQNVIQAASSRQPLPSNFPEHFIPRFNQLGKNLRDDEYIELREPGQQVGPRYDRATRKFLILQREREYDASVDLLAEVRGGVLDRELIVLRLDDGSLIDARALEAQVQQALEFVTAQVRVTGWGAFDQNDRLQRIIKLEELIPVEDEMTPLALLDARFAELGELREGWFEPGSPRLDPSGLASFKSFIRQVVTEGITTSPFIYPTPDGGIQAEWSFPSWEVSAKASLTNGVLYLHATHLEGDDIWDTEIKLNAPEVVSSFHKFMNQFAR